MKKRLKIVKGQFIPIDMTEIHTEMHKFTRLRLGSIIICGVLSLISLLDLPKICICILFYGNLVSLTFHFYCVYKYCNLRLKRRDRMAEIMKERFG